MLAIDINFLKLDLYDDDTYLSYLEGHKEQRYRIINDDMSGNYCFFGIIIKQSNYYDGFDRKPVTMFSDLFLIENVKIDISYKASELFNFGFDESHVDLYCFTKYS
jgi:hypothetical protein